MIQVFLASSIYILSGGFSWFFVKMHAGYNIPVEFSIVYRQIIVCIIFFIVALITKRRILLSFKELKLCLFVGIFYYSFYMLGAYYGSLFLISGIVSFIGSMKIIFVEIILSIYNKERPSTRIFISAMFGSVGIYFLSVANMKIEHLNRHMILKGILLAMISPIGNAISNVTLELSNRKKNIDNVVMISYCSLVGSVIVLAIGMLRHKQIILPPFEFKYLLGLSYLSCISSGLAVLCVYFLISKIGSLKTTYMSLSHAPLAILLAVIFQGYRLNLNTIIGIIFCCYSLYIGMRYQARKGKYQKHRQMVNSRRNRKKIVKYIESKLKIVTSI